MLFAAARAVGWAGDNTTLEHATFGSVMGDNRKPLKTRDGKNIKLRELLDEAEQRAADLLDERNQQRGGDDNESVDPVFTEHEIGEITRRVGIASVKYADLRKRSGQRLRLQLGQDAGDARQHGAVYDVRLCSDSLDLSQGGRALRRAGRLRRRRYDRPG